MKILIISGSPRKEARSPRVAYALQKYLTEKTDHQIDLIDLRHTQFPAIQKVITSVEAAPDEIKEPVALVFNADAYIWVNPEYNGTYPGAFKNFVDHFPKLMHKAVGICSVSNGAFGGLRSTQQLVLLAAATFAILSPQFLTVPQLETKFDAEGNLVDPAFENNIKNFITEFLWLAERTSAIP